MSNLALFNAGDVPDFVRNAAPSALTASLAGGGNAGKRVSIKGGVFRLFDGGKEVGASPDRHLDVVIVAAAPKIWRTFYAEQYQEGVTSAPTCWSENGDAPNADVKAPQHTTCQGCPQNSKGSGNGDSRACRFGQSVAVVLANNIRGDVLKMHFPATSVFGRDEGGIRGLQAYARFLGAHKAGADQVVTRMAFDLSSTAPKVGFAAQRWLTADEYATVLEQGRSDAAVQAITFSVFAHDNSGEIPGEPPVAPAVAPAPVAKAPKAVFAAAPAPAPAPKVEVAEVAAADPFVRPAASAGAPKVAARTSLADLASKWATDD